MSKKVTLPINLGKRDQRVETPGERWTDLAEMWNKLVRDIAERVLLTLREQAAPRRANVAKPMVTPVTGSSNAQLFRHRRTGRWDAKCGFQVFLRQHLKRKDYLEALVFLRNFERTLRALAEPESDDARTDQTAGNTRRR